MSVTRGEHAGPPGDDHGVTEVGGMQFLMMLALVALLAMVTLLVLR
jgi:hypothetical protein